VDALNDAEALVKALKENLDDMQRWVNEFMSEYLEKMDE